jgi:hypothetical protein
MADNVTAVSTTRVLLRVKRRRPVATATPIDDDDDGPTTSRTRTNDINDDNVPDRIRFILPRDRGTVATTAAAEANSSTSDEEREVVLKLTTVRNIARLQN